MVAMLKDKLLACMRGYAELVKTILLACMRGYAELVKTILEYPEADVEVLDKDGDPPIVFSLAAGTPDCLKTLIKKGANVNAKLKEGLGPSVAHVCAFHGQPDCMRGTTQNGKEIVVKKLSEITGQRKKRFWNEVHSLAQSRHRNIVTLLGYCAEESEGFLVYEYMPNKSLDEFLSHPNKCNALDWHKRYNIILGIANGLLYLHRDSPQLIAHGDIKPENILLDEKLNPKIADFDISKLLSMEFVRKRGKCTDC